MSSAATANPAASPPPASKPPPGSKGADYHRKCTGAALRTVEAHSSLPLHDAARPQSSPTITLFGAAFCPFVHRVWIALEHLAIPYRYVEVDPYTKPAELLQVNPKGLVPSLRLEEAPASARRATDGAGGVAPRSARAKGLGESTVILEYLHERFVDAGAAYTGRRLLPPLNAGEAALYARAHARLVAHHVNAKTIPAFYRFLQAQDPAKQAEYAREFTDELRWFEARLVESDKRGGASGPFFGGQDDLTWVDVTLAPWAFRATNVLKHFRALDLASSDLFPPGSRYHAWQEAVFAHPALVATTSTEDLYLDSYSRYAENRPNTSQVAKAINEGRALP